MGPFIWRLDPDGRAVVIAGSGVSGTPVDGEAASAADLGRPADLALDRRERLYFADPDNHHVMRIETDGRLTRIAGTGRPGYGGDGGAAREALLNEPYDLAFDDADNLYIADHLNHRVRKVTPEGTISTVAGTGTPGYSGDHGPAAAAELNGVYGVRGHPDGRLLISNSGNHVVRQITPDGIITTLAGTGEAGNAGDGGPAAQARLNAPEIAVRRRRRQPLRRRRSQPQRSGGRPGRRHHDADGRWRARLCVGRASGCRRAAQRSRNRSWSAATARS